MPFFDIHLYAYNVIFSNPSYALTIDSKKNHMLVLDAVKGRLHMFFSFTCTPI
jgi:hypothetical protein